MKYRKSAILKRLSCLKICRSHAFSIFTPLSFEKAAKQLTLTSNNVTEVAMGYGFSTTSYFIQVFKEKYHVTPKQFQLLHNKYANSVINIPDNLNSHF